MSCENCEKEDEILRKSIEFEDRLRELIDEYNTEIPVEYLASSMILEAKIEMCCTSPCFHHMLGVLSYFLHLDIKSMWQEMKPKEEDQ